MFVDAHLIDTLELRGLTLAGLSFGGWIAAELATKSCHGFDRLVLVDALGLKLSEPSKPDIFDIFNGSVEEVARRR